MAVGTTSAAAKLRARLNHPVIDSDGHWVEFGPQLNDYLKLVGGTRALEGFKSRPTEDWHLTLPQAERRERRLDAPIWWGVPTRNTLDHATSMLPQLLYQRLDDLRFDFVVVYPSAGLRTPFIVDAELRQVACRAFNMFSADLFRSHRDRVAPAAVIPMHTPSEAVTELEYAVKTLGLKVAMMASLIRRPIRSSQPSPRYNEWFDVLGLDSEHDYDPLWAKKTYEQRTVEIGGINLFESLGDYVSPSAQSDHCKECIPNRRSRGRSRS